MASACITIFLLARNNLPRNCKTSNAGIKVGDQSPHPPCRRLCKQLCAPYGHQSHSSINLLGHNVLFEIVQRLSLALSFCPRSLLDRCILWPHFKLQLSGSYVKIITVEPHYIELAYIEFPVISKSFPRPGQLPYSDASISAISKLSRRSPELRYNGVRLYINF
jgi:hypothetical protein